MKPMSRAQLAGSSTDAWRDWLRDGLRVFTGHTSITERIRAFDPLVVSPKHHNPAANLATQIDELLRGRTTVAARAVTEVLQSWSPVLDGAEGAAMAVQLSTRLGASGLAEASLRLAVRAQDLPTASWEWLVWTLIQAAGARFSRSETDALARTISASHSWSPSLVAEFASVLAAEALDDMPARMISGIPEIMAEPHTGETARAVGRRLALDHDPLYLRRALSPADADDEHLARLKRVLLEEAGLARSTPAPLGGRWRSRDPAALALQLEIPDSPAAEETFQQFQMTMQDLANMPAVGPPQ